MVRKHLIELLHDNPMSVAQIARAVGERPREVADDVERLLLSLKHKDYLAAIVPAQCRKCGFEFAEHKLQRPSQCPACHSTRLTEPRISLERKPALP